MRNRDIKKVTKGRVGGRLIWRGVGIGKIFDRVGKYDFYFKKWKKGNQRPKYGKIQEC